MVYITIKQPPRYRQMTLDEFLSLMPLASPSTSALITSNFANTKTYERTYVGEALEKKLGFNIVSLVLKLKTFNEETEELRKRPRKELYYEFHIPKKSGGLRKIDAPNDELMNALRKLKTIFENDFGALYHTSAFAYIRGRSTIDAVKRHQLNESKWFAKYDLSNFFGSTTLEFVLSMFSMVYPFSEIMKYPAGRENLAKALELAFLDGGLPQGTPISPLITNIMMIPVDFKLSNGLRDFNRQHFVYTRYADDFIISSRYDFSFREIEKYVCDTLASFAAPFTIKSEKTRYGSSAGSNWNLGVMLNSENQMTIGYRKKRQFKAMLTSFVLDIKNGKKWDLHDIQVMEGYRNYYRMIEKSTIDEIIKHIDDKFGVNSVEMIKNELRN